MVALGWCVTNQMVEGAGGFIQFGLLGASRQHPVETLLLSLGPVLLTGVAGLLPAREVPLGLAVPSTVPVTVARSLRVDYVYVDEVERRAYLNGISFDRSPSFEKVFEDTPVASIACADRWSAVPALRDPPADM